MKAYLEPKEINLMEEACPNLRDRLLIHFLFHTACRVTEALGIAVEDINLAEGTVTIQHLNSTSVWFSAVSRLLNTLGQLPPKALRLQMEFYCKGDPGRS